MLEQNFIAAVSVLVSAIGIVTVGSMFRSYQLDKFREKIFALREEVFLYSLDEGLLDDISHNNFRDLLNSLLRYAHKVTFPHMVALLVTKRALKISFDPDVAPMADWERAIADLSTTQQERYRCFNKKAMSLVVKHIVSRSLLFWIFAVCALGPRIVRGQLATSWSIIKAAIRALVPVSLFEAEALRASKAHT